MLASGRVVANRCRKSSSVTRSDQPSEAAMRRKASRTSVRRPHRSYSYRLAGPLDQPMDRSRGRRAKNFGDGLTDRELAGASAEFGDDSASRRAACNRNWSITRTTRTKSKARRKWHEAARDTAHEQNSDFAELLLRIAILPASVAMLAKARGRPVHDRRLRARHRIGFKGEHWGRAGRSDEESIIPRGASDRPEMPRCATPPSIPRRFCGRSRALSGTPLRLPCARRP